MALGGLGPLSSPIKSSVIGALWYRGSMGWQSTGPNLTFDGTTLTANALSASTVTATTYTGLPSSSAWSSLTDSAGSITIAMAAFTTNMTWNTATSGNQMVFSSSSLTSGVLASINCTSTGAASNTQSCLAVNQSGNNVTSSQKTRCAAFHNTKTGTSSTNEGLHVTASGGSNNYALIVTAGLVGLQSASDIPLAQFHMHGNGALSLPGALFDGSVITGGTATTCKPYVLIENAGTSNAWNTAGTQLGINAVSGFTGMLLDCQLVAVSKFSVDASGNALHAGTLGVTGIATMSNATASTSTTTGGLIVSGGLGVAGAVNAASIKFANAGATMANYDEGTFTPTIAGTSTAGTQTYGVQVGRYTRVGNRVHFSIYVAMTAKDGTTAGTVEIRGLPIASKNTSNALHGVSIGYIANVTLSGSKVSWYANISVNSAAIQIGESQSAAAGALMPVANIAATSEFIISGTYEV